MANAAPPSFGERMIEPVTNISDFIWGGTWNGEAVIPFPPLAIILLGIGLWIMIGLRFYLCGALQRPQGCRRRRDIAFCGALHGVVRTGRHG